MLTGRAFAFWGGRGGGLAGGVVGATEAVGMVGRKSRGMGKITPLYFRTEPGSPKYQVNHSSHRPRAAYLTRGFAFSISYREIANQLSSHLGLARDLMRTGSTGRACRNNLDIDFWNYKFNILNINQQYSDEIQEAFYKTFILSKNNGNKNAELKNYFLINYFNFDKNYQDKIIEKF